MSRAPVLVSKAGRFVTVLGVAAVCSVLTWSHAPRAPAAPPPRPEAALTVPPGFVVERVAGPPLVEHPMMGCFDERGRLFLAEAAGLNLKFEDLRRNPPNYIRVLDPADTAGRFRQGHVFADRLTFPMGALWYQGALFTTAAPSFWRLNDRRGVAGKRQELVTGFTSVGNGADIHGPFLGPDGRFYWTKGRHPHEIKKPDGSVLMQGTAARIFRSRPDGSDLEVVCGGGMDDPVEIAFTEEGEPLATVDILVGKPKRIDAIIYGIEGGVYPHDESVLAEFKRTGDLLPPVADLGWVAPSGLMRYRSETFGKEYRGNLFSAQFNTHKIQRHIIERDGAGFRARSEDFLVSADPDFHPTDVLEDADGSLLVIDTGGWFRIGCPNSQIAKPEVKGGIYRIRKKDGQPPVDPRGLVLRWDLLFPQNTARLFDDPRFAVRDLALELFSSYHVFSVRLLQSALQNHPSARARRNAVWAATRMDGPEARAYVRDALMDTNSSVRLSATHSAGLHRDSEALLRLMELVSTDEPAIRRQAAAALGRLRNPQAIPAIFTALRAGGDRFLEHSLIYALIQVGDQSATAKGLHDPSPLVRRAALIALDQMDNGALTREQVTPLLTTSDPALQKTALQVITARPAWGKEIVQLLGDWLASDRDLPSERQDSVRGAILAFAGDHAIQELLAGTLRGPNTPRSTRLLLLETIGRCPLPKLPDSWVRELGSALDNRDDTLTRQAVAAIRMANLEQFDRTLIELARDRSRGDELRVAALAAVIGRLAPLDLELFEFLITRLRTLEAPLTRLLVAEALGNARLDDGQLAALAKALRVAGPLEMPHLVAAFEHSRDAEIGRQLLASIEHAAASQSLSVETLRRTFLNYPPDVQRGLEPLLKRLAPDADKERTRLAGLESTMAAGDPRLGREVFFGKKAACSACHTISNDGGRIGPDLTKIGGIRSKRDLLEAIVFPSSSIVRGYEAYTVATRAGRLHTGIIRRETADAIDLITPERAEIRLPRSAIESIERSRISIMPQGLDTQLARRELADLVAYLQSLK